MCYMSHITHVTCHKYQVAKITELAAKTTNLTAKTTELDAKTTELAFKTSELNAKTIKLAAKTTKLAAKTTQLKLFWWYMEQVLYLPAVIYHALRNFLWTVLFYI